MNKEREGIKGRLKKDYRRKQTRKRGRKDERRDTKKDGLNIEKMDRIRNTRGRAEEKNEKNDSGVSQEGGGLFTGSES